MNIESTKSPRDCERERLNQFPEVEASGVPRPGALLSDEIERCCKEFSLISPFSRDQLKPASYRLTVGSRFSLGSRRQSLNDSEEIRIPPFQVAVIQTRETLNLPRNMIARWNIKVARAYEGLIWAGGPQVDPGYQGHLFCPIYNLSNKEVTLAYGAEIAVIDFVTTTDFSKNTIKFERPPKSLLFEDYQTPQSGLSDAWDRIQSFESRIENIDTKVTVYLGIVLAFIGVIIAALAVMVTANPQMIKSLKFSDLLALAFSFIAMGASACGWIWIRSRPQRDGKLVAYAWGMLLLGIFLGALAMYFVLPLASR